MSFTPQISNTLIELNGLIVKSDSECNTALGTEAPGPDAVEGEQVNIGLI